MHKGVCPDCHVLASPADWCGRCDRCLYDCRCELGEVHRLVPIVLALAGSVGLAFVAVCRRWFELQ